MRTLETFIVVSSLPVVIEDAGVGISYAPGAIFRALSNNDSVVRLLEQGKISRSSGTTESPGFTIVVGPRGPTGPSGTGAGLSPVLDIANETDGHDIIINDGDAVDFGGHVTAQYDTWTRNYGPGEGVTFQVNGNDVLVIGYDAGGVCNMPVNTYFSWSDTTDANGNSIASLGYYDVVGNPALTVPQFYIGAPEITFGTHDLAGFNYVKRIWLTADGLIEIGPNPIAFGAVFGTPLTTITHDTYTENWGGDWVITGIAIQPAGSPGAPIRIGSDPDGNTQLVFDSGSSGIHFVDTFGSQDPNALLAEIRHRVSLPGLGYSAQAHAFIEMTAVGTLWAEAERMRIDNGIIDLGPTPLAFGGTLGAQESTIYFEDFYDTLWGGSWPLENNLVLTPLGGPPLRIGHSTGDDETYIQFEIGGSVTWVDPDNTHNRGSITVWTTPPRPMYIEAGVIVFNEMTNYGNDYAANEFMRLLDGAVRLGDSGLTFDDIDGGYGKVAIKYEAALLGGVGDDGLVIRDAGVFIAAFFDASGEPAIVLPKGGVIYWGNGIDIYGNYIYTHPTTGALWSHSDTENRVTSDLKISLGCGTEVIGIAPDALGFFSATPVARPTITGSQGGNAALASLLAALASYGLITDSTTA